MIDFKIGPSRSAEGALPIGGTIVPRPFNIIHTPLTVIGNRLGGSVAYGTSYRMEWIYDVGTTALYAELNAQYNPANPWVWVRIYDMETGLGRWYEAVMGSPKFTRSGGNVIANLSVMFTSLRSVTIHAST
jgi:hypothetical protein